MSKIIKVDSTPKVPPGAEPADPDDHAPQTGPFAAIHNHPERPEWDFELDRLILRFQTKDYPDDRDRDEIEFTQGGKQQLEPLFLKQFGFKRMPVTWAEFSGMFDYCYNMHLYSGYYYDDRKSHEYNMDDYFAEALKTGRPAMVPALIAYLDGDIDGMRRANTEELIAEVAKSWLINSASRAHKE